MISTSLIAVVGASYFASFLATRLLIPILAKRVVDHPNHRSSHAVPTPRGGGLGVLAGIVLGWGLIGAGVGWEAAQDWLLLLLCALGLAAVSFLDDIRSLPARIRLGAQIVAVGAGLLLIPSAEGGSGPNGAFVAFMPVWLDLPLTAFLWLWFINLFNFMDGIDGITGTETTSICIGLIALAGFGLAPTVLSALAMPVAAAALGFLVWNWSPAKIFLGDVGSVPLGFLLGYLLIGLAASDSGNGAALAAALCLPLFHVLDASITLIRRLLRGKPATEAHREHVYQRATIAGRSAAFVCVVWAGVNGILIAVSLILAPLFGLVAVAVGVAVVLAGFWGLRPAPIPAPVVSHEPGDAS